MRMRLLPAALLLSTLPLTAQDDGHAGWHADFDEAVEVAKAEGKDLLVDFTGSDWCGWCIRLNKEVFDHAEWLDEVKKDWVLVALDFPNAEEVKAKVPNPDRNRELQGKYKVAGFPTILLMDADGTVYGRTGYREGGPTPYLEHMKELRKNGKEALARVAAMQVEIVKATGEERAGLIQQAIDMLGNTSSDQPGADKIAAIARLGLSDDKLAEGALMALLKSGTAEADDYAKAEELDPKNEKGLLEQCVAAKMGQVSSQDMIKDVLASIDALLAHGPIRDKEIAKNVYANAAFWNHRFTKDAEAAKRYAEMLKEVAGDDQRFAGLFKMINGDG
ncbi:MAG: thioredoxin family protein [Planctomycetota bacterium]